MLATIYLPLWTIPAAVWVACLAWIILDNRKHRRPKTTRPERDRNDWW